MQDWIIILVIFTILGWIIAIIQIVKNQEKANEIESLKKKDSDLSIKNQHLNRDNREKINEIDNLKKECSNLSIKNQHLTEENKTQESALLANHLDKKEYETTIKNLANKLKKANEELEQSDTQIDRLTYSLKEKEKYIESSHASLEQLLQDHLKSFPYIAGMIADYLVLEDHKYNTYHGRSEKQNERKLRIDTLIREKEELIASAKELRYQLDFLLTAFPALSDFLDTEYKDIPLSFDYSKDHDPVRDYLSAEEYQNMSETEKNQLALDRYIESHKKSKWQVGRDYELSVGYQYEKKGYKVQYTGSTEGLADLGRDLIATKDATDLIIQCKYWGAEKMIREKHIAQLYGTALCYQVDHPFFKVIPVFVTNTRLSDEAKEFADKLNVSYVENFAFKEFPRIKCNMGKDENGAPTYIYHLPMDQQYDSVVINKPGERLCYTVAEAESYHFRRAYRWHEKKEN